MFPWRSAIRSRSSGRDGILMAIAVGIQFEPPGKGVAKAALVYAGRLVSALAVAVVFVLIFGLTGADRTVLLLLGVAPTPFFVVAFATVENLDVRLTVNTVSLSMPMSLPLALGVILLTTELLRWKCAANAQSERGSRCPRS